MCRYSYFFWRITYIAIKPVSILLANELLGDESANLVALAVLISGTLMAALSLGTYKNIFKYRSGSIRTEYFQKIRRLVFLLNFALLSFIAGGALYWGGVAPAGFVLLFVVAEYVVHDDSRISLYSGDRLAWARQNSLRTLFVPLVPLLSAGFSIGLDVAMLVLFFLNAFVSFCLGGVFRIDNSIVALLFKRRSYFRYFSQFNYFLSSISNRVVQQSDKFIFSALNYELFWLYTIVCQVANLPLMFFEMSYMSAFKARVAKSVDHVFSWLSLGQVMTILMVSGLAIVVYALAVIYIPELGSSLFILMFMVILMVNFTSAISMQNSESLFWSMSDKRKFAKLELQALLFGHLVAVPIMFFGFYALAKAPNLISILFKIRNSKKWLSCTKA